MTTCVSGCSKVVTKLNNLDKSFPLVNDIIESLIKSAYNIYADYPISELVAIVSNTVHTTSTTYLVYKAWHTDLCANPQHYYDLITDILTRVLHNYDILYHRAYSGTSMKFPRSFSNTILYLQTCECHYLNILYKISKLSFHMLLDKITIQTMTRLDARNKLESFI